MIRKEKKALAPPSARAVAADLLEGVLRKGLAMDDLMSRHQGLANLEKRDRAFTHALVACVLRRLGQIDAAIKACLDKKDDLKAPAMDLLRLGAAQLLFLGTPAHAAVDATVEVAGASNATRPYKNLINAVLRRLTREGAALVKVQDEARLNTPEWLWASWSKAYGGQGARSIALANLGEALIDITVKNDPEGWAQKLGGKLLPTGSIRLDDLVPVQERAGFAEGNWWVQDAAAALPVRLLGDVQGKRVMDLCAAPGGKTLQLAAAGAHVSAVDRSEKRLVRLRENLKRTGLEAAVFCADALTCKLAQKADAVLLDAPCTATGTMRRHPDVLHLKKPEDRDRMVDLQARLLDHAATELLAEGGMLVYAVCSLQPEEAEGQVRNFLARHPSFRRVPVDPAEIGGAAELINSDGDLRCLPSHWQDQGGLDGFFASRLVKG